MSAYDEAVVELEDTLRRLAPALNGEGALLSEWWLVLGTTNATSGRNLLDVVAPPSTLMSHTLGALRFAQLHTEARILEDDDR